MSILDKLRKAKQPKEEQVKDEPKQEGLSLEDHQKLRKQLEGILYSDDLVDEFLPVFEKLHNQEGFNKVLELLEAKETELNLLNQSDEYFKQESDIETKTSETTEETNGNEDYLMSILNERYGE